VVPIICLLIAAVTGGVLFPQIRQTDMVAWRAGYEKRYKPLQSDPHPRIRQIRASIDLFPSARRYRVRGTYIVANETPAAIGQVLIALRRGDEPSLVRFDPPITPGGIRAISFSVTHANLDPFAPNHTIVENGSYLTSLDALPALGYRSGWELDDPHQRRRQGLPPAVPRSESEIPLAEWVSLDLRVSTEADQTVVAPGRLLSNDVHGQRRTFHYRTAAPVPNQFAVSSARYAVSTVMRDGVSIEIYHHPGHEQNVAGMQTAAANAIEWFGSGFGPYTRDHLRIAEVPIPGFSAFAQPGVVFFGENRGFLIDARDSRRLDLLTRRVAHEIAHQWFGYTLVPADVPGASTLTESLTKYAELLALERTRGKAQVGASLAYELDLYLSGRTGVVGAEPPLTRARADQPFLYYRKGAIALYAIKELIGEAAMNGALRRLIAEQGGVARRPTTAHLVSALKRAAPPGDHALIDEWLGAVVLYDIGLLAATAVARGSDYETTLLIHAAKDGTPFDESVDVALYGESKQVQIERHLLQAGQQAITVRSPFRPLAAAVDPYHTRVDRNRFDNERQID
jgi:hypothetical protein